MSNDPIKVVNDSVNGAIDAFKKNDMSTNVAIGVGAVVAVTVMPTIMAIFGAAVAAKKVAEMIGDSDTIVEKSKG